MIEDGTEVYLTTPGDVLEGKEDNFLKNDKGEICYTVAIPSGILCGHLSYITVHSNADGTLYIGERYYYSKNVVRRHNTQIIGGLTRNRILGSSVAWVWRFAKPIRISDQLKASSDYSKE